MKNILLSSLLILFLISCEGGCEKPNSQISKTIEQSDTTDSLDIVVVESSVTSEMEANIKSTLKSYLQAQSDGDYVKFMAFAYAGIFDSEEQKQKQIDMMAGYYEGGMQNKLIEHEVKYISPIVELDSANIVLVKFKAKIDVVFTEEFIGKPKNYENMIKEKYGQDVVYDSLTTTFHADGIHRMYAITPKDSISFTWLAEGFAQAPQLSNLIKFDQLIQLREYAR